MDTGYVSTINTLIKEGYDRVDRADVSPTVETYTFSFDGDVIGIITVTYTDATQNKILSAVLS